MGGVFFAAQALLRKSVTKATPGRYTTDKDIEMPMAVGTAVDLQGVKIFQDLFEMWSIFKLDMHLNVVTKGGDNDFWKKLSENRLKMLESMLLELGVEKKFLICK